MKQATSEVNLKWPKDDVPSTLRAGEVSVKIDARVNLEARHSSFVNERCQSSKSL